MGIQNVLLVDDEPDIRLIGEISLTRVGGFDVRVAASGEEALALVREAHPDVVLLDVMMPGMDGPTVLRLLRDDPSTRGIPVVFVTGKVQRHEVLEYLELGASGVLSKPFDPMTLPDDVRRILTQ